MKSKIVDEDLKEIYKVIGEEEFKKLNGKTIMVTGCNGLIASYIIETIAYVNQFLLIPCVVIAIYRNENNRLSHLRNKREIIFHKFDVREKCDCFYVKPDYIIHAAGRSTPQYFTEHPIETIQVNLAIEWMLKSAMEYRAEVIYFSSSEIYSDPSIIPTPEDCPGNGRVSSKRACYIESKRCAEVLCLAYNKKFKVPVKILRPMLTYGPGLSIYDHRVLCDFMRQGIQKKPIELLDKGLSTRSYCYIVDTLVMFFKILFSTESIGIYNLGNPKEEKTIREIAGLVGEICGVEVKTPIIPIKKVVDAPLRACLNINKFISRFKYEPRYTLKEGIERTIDWNIEQNRIP